MSRKSLTIHESLCGDFTFGSEYESLNIIPEIGCKVLPLFKLAVQKHKLTLKYFRVEHYVKINLHDGILHYYHVDDDEIAELLNYLIDNLHLIPTDRVVVVNGVAISRPLVFNWHMEIESTNYTNLLKTVENTSTLSNFVIELLYYNMCFRLYETRVVFYDYNRSTDAIDASQAFHWFIDILNTCGIKKSAMINIPGCHADYIKRNIYYSLTTFKSVSFNRMCNESTRYVLNMFAFDSLLMCKARRSTLSIISRLPTEIFRLIFENLNG